MKKRSSDTSYSNDHLFYDLLVKIFMALNVADLAVVSRVCKSWNQACRDPTLWYKLDLSRMSSFSFNVPKKLDAWYDKRSSARMTQFLKYALDLSNGKTSCLIFNYYVYIRDVHLITAAQRTPNLKRLVLPASGRLSRIGIDVAMKSWEGLESITITPMVKEERIFSAIAKYCKNITELKFTCSFEQFHADALINYTPNLKALSIRSTLVNMRALCSVLECFEHLEVINICHCLILDRPDGGDIVVYHIRDLRRQLDVSCLRKIIFCREKRCTKCKNDSINNRRGQPYDLLEELWRQDDILSLAH